MTEQLLAVAPAVRRPVPQSEEQHQVHQVAGQQQALPAVESWLVQSVVEPRLVPRFVEGQLAEQIVEA